MVLPALDGLRKFPTGDVLGWEHFKLGLPLVCLPKQLEFSGSTGSLLAVRSVLWRALHSQQVLTYVALLQEAVLHSAPVALLLSGICPWGHH